MQLIKDPKVRLYIYRVVLAGILLLQAFRLIPGDNMTETINFLTALLGITAPVLAIPNTPDSRPKA